MDTAHSLTSVLLLARCHYSLPIQRFALPVGVGLSRIGFLPLSMGFTIHDVAGVWIRDGQRPVHRRRSVDLGGGGNESHERGIPLWSYRDRVYPICRRGIVALGPFTRERLQGAGIVRAQFLQQPCGGFLGIGADPCARDSSGGKSWFSGVSDAELRISRAASTPCSLVSSATKRGKFW